ncbi:hypothetical protein [Natronosalvus rutilus]|uniref:Uncharacterized protein n=1 Tax=Natronosalvus rutilus TaxID=2953753 RepID=A0A9E7N9G7_9EURY|nr:hypothetical protein [Natronosalvus rutilus]UTF53910.1 hypothetical protein NGM29_01090 [Natronosalvus rutilus]
MASERDASTIRRRTLLASAASMGGSSVTGTATAKRSERSSRRCPEATIGTDAAPCDGASTDGCADDHPTTVELRERARAAMERRYATVGDLIDRGFVPYFDAARLESENGWSHWLHPAHIGDDTVLDPDRPEAVLVDNEFWRPIGVMFIATVDGDPVERPPALYAREDAESEGTDDLPAAERRCSPWHYHRGLPGRFAWKYYRQVYEHDYREGELSLPCRTPCVLHVWTVPHPDGTHAHGAPPPAERGGPPANDPGFETDADPDETRLDWDVLPDDVVPNLKPGDLLESW